MSFKKKVLSIVRKIPKGKFLTYKNIAELAGSPRAWRAAGNVLSKNKDPKIPCHRVVRSNGRIGGYKDGPQKKASLLRKENLIIKKRKLLFNK